MNARTSRHPVTYNSSFVEQVRQLPGLRSQDCRTLQVLPSLVLLCDRVIVAMVIIVSLQLQ